MYVCMYVVITTLLVPPGGLGRAFHPSLYQANNFAPYYTTYSLYSVGTKTNQKDKDPLGSFHGDIHLNVILWYSHGWSENSYLPTLS